MAKKPTVAGLMAEIEALRRRVAELEARPPVVIHNHPPAVQPPQFYPLPYTVPAPNWRLPGDIWCATESAGELGLTWNGGGSSCIGGWDGIERERTGLAIHGGGSGG